MVGLSRSGPLLVSGSRNGYLLQGYGDLSDYYSFPVKAGNSYMISYDPSLLSLVLYEVDDYGRVHERSDYTDQGVVAGYNGSALFGFIPKSCLVNYLNYSFSITVFDSVSWSDYGTDVRDDYTPDSIRRFYIACGCSEGTCCINYHPPEGMHTMDISYESSTDPCDAGIQVFYIESLDGIQHPIEDLVNLNISPTDYIYSFGSRKFFNISVRVFNPSECSGTITLKSIIANVDSNGYYSYRVLNNSILSPGNSGYFMGRVPVIGSNAERSVHMQVEFIRSGTTKNNYVSDPFYYGVDEIFSPDLEMFRSFSEYDRLNLVMNASDEEGLTYAVFYKDSATVIPGCEWVNFTGGLASCDYNTSGETNGIVKWVYAKVYNVADGWFRTKTINITVRNDNSAPVINASIVSSTPNGETLNNTVRGVVSLSVLAYDSESGVKQILWYIDNQYKGAGNEFAWNTQGLNGEHNINVTVKDLPGHSVSKSSTVYADNAPPVIVSVTPGAGQKIDNTVYLAVNASDASGIRSVDWYLQTTNGLVRIGSGQRTYWGCGGLSGNYSIIVNVSDLVGNVATRTVPVEIRSPDLSVANLSLTPSVPIVGTTTSLKLTIENKGSIIAKNIVIKSYDDWNETNSTVLAELTSLKTANVLIGWIPTSSGEHNLTLVIDPEDYISESNETNNFLVTRIIVGSSNSTTTTVSSTTTTTLNLPPILSFNVYPSSGPVGTFLSLNVSATDDLGLNNISSLYSGSWHFYSCAGATSCQYSWIISESQPGNYTYYGNAFDLLGQRDSAWNTTKKIIVNIGTTSLGSTTSTTTTTTTTSMSTTSTLPNQPVTCWNSSDYVGINLASNMRKFCKCIEGNYSYQDYISSSQNRTVREYINMSDNIDWTTQVVSNSYGTDGVQCSNGNWYSPQNDYYSICILNGDYWPCGIITISEIVTRINLWVAGESTLNEVVALIVQWAQPESQYNKMMASSTSDSVSASRNLPAYTFPGQAINVTLDIEVNEASMPNALGLIEYVPSGWTVSSVSSGGVYFSGKSTVEWLFSNFTTPVQSTVVSYILHIPNGSLSQNYSLYGTFDMGSDVYDTSGNTFLNVLCSANSSCGSMYYVSYDPLSCSNDGTSRISGAYFYPSCQNSGSYSAYCTNDIVENTVGTCPYGCQNNVCYYCRMDTDCGQPSYINNSIYCYDINTLAPGTWAIPRCRFNDNTHQKDYSCESEWQRQLLTCTFECLNGACNQPTTTTTTTTTLPECSMSDSFCSVPDGDLICGETIEGCLNGVNWKFYQINGSENKRVLLNLTYVGEGCNDNRLFVFDGNCIDQDYVDQGPFSKYWDGIMTSRVTVGIAGDSGNPYCEWKLIVNCVNATTTTTTTSTTTTTTTTTTTSTSTTLPQCDITGSECETSTESINCGTTISGCLYAYDWRIYSVNGSSGKRVTVNLTYNGAGCNINDLYIFNTTCGERALIDHENNTKIWTGNAYSGIKIGIDGDSNNTYCLWTLNVSCVTTTTTITTTTTTTTTSTTLANCSSGGIGICGMNFCCGVADNVCPADFTGVSCGVSDPDCGCSHGGFSFCGGSFCCGANDGVCPTDFGGVSCGVSDPDCTCPYGGVSVCGSMFCCGSSDGVCPTDFGGVSCSSYDVDCN